jgi:hypothetical protein
MEFALAAILIIAIALVSRRRSRMPTIGPAEYTGLLDLNAFRAERTRRRIAGGRR